MLLLALSGALMLLSFGGMVWLHDLRQHTIVFIALYGLAYLAYLPAVVWSLRRPSARKMLVLILSLGILFRVILLFATPPTLSDDVYRYIWDGRMTVLGINSYAHAVNSLALAPYTTPLRQLVNNLAMASPYLPVAQVIFAAIYRLAPASPLAFQVAAVLFDLLTGVIILCLLRRFKLPATRALIYLWNPLIIAEFAQGAHVDAAMLCLMMAGLALLVSQRSQFPSVFAIAAATLIKGIPLLIVPVIARRWRPHHLIAYCALLAGACLAFALGAVWGLNTKLDGTGLFGTTPLRNVLELQRRAVSLAGGRLPRFIRPERCRASDPGSKVGCGGSPLPGDYRHVMVQPPFAR